MRLILLLLIGLYIYVPIEAQQKNFTFRLYGFVRGDLFYNSRENMAPIEGNFYLFPLDKYYDADGKDLNASPNGSFYTFTSRLGLDVKGPDILKASTTAKIETDFGGFAGHHTMLRIRQAYVNLDWDRINLLVGITWHPLFGSVVPDVLNLSTGAPFQPFNRSPQIRLQYTVNDKTQLTTSLLWQLQYLSNGPKGMSASYLKNSCIPEVFVGMDFIPTKDWLFGVGAYMISLKPRTSSDWKGKTWKVNERMTAFSYGVHLKYSGRNYIFAAKSLISSALDHTAILGGYGVSSIDPYNGEQKYTAFRHSTSWINFVYGSKWKPGLFVGYTKNLGSLKSLVSRDKLYGLGLDIDQLLTFNVNLSYNLSHWKLGVEYCPSTAFYGTTNLKSGCVEQTHAVTNHRILGLLMYFF